MKKIMAVMAITLATLVANPGYAEHDLWEQDTAAQSQPETKRAAPTGEKSPCCAACDKRDEKPTVQESPARRDILDRPRL